MFFYSEKIARASGRESFQKVSVCGINSAIHSTSTRYSFAGGSVSD